MKNLFTLPAFNDLNNFVWQGAGIQSVPTGIEQTENKNEKTLPPDQQAAKDKQEATDILNKLTSGSSEFLTPTQHDAVLNKFGERILEAGSVNPQTKLQLQSEIFKIIPNIKKENPIKESPLMKSITGGIKEGIDSIKNTVNTISENITKIGEILPEGATMKRVEGKGYSEVQVSIDGNQIGALRQYENGTFGYSIDGEKSIMAPIISLTPGVPTGADMAYQVLGDHFQTIKGEQVKTKIKEQAKEKQKNVNNEAKDIANNTCLKHPALTDAVIQAMEIDTTMDNITQVIQIQDQLIDMGYSVGDKGSDGWGGTDTQKALTQFNTAFDALGATPNDKKNKDVHPKLLALKLATLEPGEQDDNKALAMKRESIRNVAKNLPGATPLSEEGTTFKANEKDLLGLLSSNFEQQKKNLTLPQNITEEDINQETLKKWEKQQDELESVIRANTTNEDTLDLEQRYGGNDEMIANLKNKINTSISDLKGLKNGIEKNQTMSPKEKEKSIASIDQKMENIVGKKTKLPFRVTKDSMPDVYINDDGSVTTLTEHENQEKIAKAKNDNEQNLADTMDKLGVTNEGQIRTIDAKDGTSYMLSKADNTLLHKIAGLKRGDTPGKIFVEGPQDKSLITGILQSADVGDHVITTKSLNMILNETNGGYQSLAAEKALVPTEAEVKLQKKQAANTKFLDAHQDFLTDEIKTEFGITKGMNNEQQVEQIQTELSKSTYLQEDTTGKPQAKPYYTKNIDSWAGEATNDALKLYKEDVNTMNILDAV